MAGADAPRIPWFGARKTARTLAAELQTLKRQCTEMREQLARSGALSMFELDQRRAGLEQQIADQRALLQRDREAAVRELDAAHAHLAEIRKAVVATEELAQLQEAGVYKYQHPLSDALGYQDALRKIEDEIREMNLKEGGAVLAEQKWTVNGSEAQGRKA